MGKIGVGVIGVGVFGENHCRVYTNDPSTELRAICDLNEPRMAEIAGKFGSPDQYTDYKAMLARDDIDVVSVVTPDFAHRDIAIACAEAGKHILLEKPMATTVEDCQAIKAAVERAGVKLMVDYHNRFNTPVLLTRQAIDKGELGRVLMMYVRLSDALYVPTGMLKWADRSTVAWFLASHGVDLITWLFGSKVKRVYSVSRSVVLKDRGIDTPDFFQTTLELSCGGVAVLETCWILSDSMQSIVDFKVEVVGSRGQVNLNPIQHGIMVKFTPEKAEMPDVTCAPDVYGQPLGFALESIRHFIRCVKGEAEILTGCDEGLEVTRVVCAIHESAAKGVPVEVV